MPPALTFVLVFMVRAHFFFSDRRSPSLVWTWKTRDINLQPLKSPAHVAADSGMQEPASLAPVVGRCAAALHRVLA
jgi:hypothetical protein